VNEDGEARLFEFMYPPEQSIEEVVGYYEDVLGPSTRYHARVAGYCYVWEEASTQFEVCAAREPAEDGTGQVIAHLRPMPAS